MRIQLLTADEFQRYQQEYENANFLQTKQMNEVHQRRGIFTETYFVAWIENEMTIGQALIGVRQRYRIFREAIILQGPIFFEQYHEYFGEMLTVLEQFLKQRHISRIEMNPYLMNDILNEQLEKCEENRYKQLISLFERKGYSRSIDWRSQRVIGQIFRKKVGHYKDTKELFNNIPKPMQRKLKKFGMNHVIIKEAFDDDIAVFYDLLSQTANRKHYSIQPLSYFKMMKEAFKEEIRVMVAYLDVDAFRKEINERIALLENQLQVLSTREVTKKTQSELKKLNEQLASDKKRKQEFDSLNLPSGLTPLSANFYICYNREVINMFVGGDSHCMNFGGASLLNWHMMCYALENGFDYYNFYGTIETEIAHLNQGNFHYKRQFGGELDVLIGIFSKTLNPVMKIIESLKR